MTALEALAILEKEFEKTAKAIQTQVDSATPADRERVPIVIAEDQGRCFGYMGALGMVRSLRNALESDQEGK